MRQTSLVIVRVAEHGELADDGGEHDELQLAVAANGHEQGHGAREPPEVEVEVPLVEQRVEDVHDGLVFLLEVAADHELDRSGEGRGRAARSQVSGNWSSWADGLVHDEHEEVFGEHLRVVDLSLSH